MIIDSRFWTPAAKDKLQWIKNKWRNLSEDSKKVMPYRKFRNQFLRDVGNVQNTREKLVQIIGDRQLASARKFYNSRRMK